MRNTMLVLGISLIVGSVGIAMAAPKEDILVTLDNETISYAHYRNGFDSVVIVCPGFFNSKENRWMVKTVELLSSGHDVIIFDFRGHGKSSGLFSWSAKEHAEVNKVLDYARSEGYNKTGLLGFSLGAASAVTAAAGRDDVTSMILISCPTAFDNINFHFWEPGMWADLKDNIDSDWDGKGARTSHVFHPKSDPVKEIVSIKKTPVLFIHGDSDWIINDSHSRKLYDSTHTKKRIEIIEEGLHAERLIQQFAPRMEHIILAWFADTMS